MDINIPIRIKAKLQQDDEWHAKIIGLERNIRNYYVLSPVFFPDYTIHGIAHVNMVLSVADRLIPDNTLHKMSGRDLAILVAAIMIHDIGMFITEDGLNELLTGKGSARSVENLDVSTWAKIWSSYKQRIKRYSDRELFRAFGDYMPLEDPCTNRAKMVRKDYLVCGEFIRQQHHRLAHDIAVNSLPGTQNRDIFEHTNFSSSERDIIGLIARSHGLAVRDTEPYITKTFADPKSPNNIPVFYLMVLLRLADYLDAGQHRAPKDLEKRQSISVPISQQEWLWNQQIDANNYSWHPENKELIIQADPKTTSEFIKIEKWLQSVQQELDMSWSIITEKYAGEIYQLSIHRIGSNLLRAETRKTMSHQFLIKEAKLVANVDLLKLLIQPLYGDDPSFGIRELIQNAIDACIERKHLESPSVAYRPEVTVSIDTKKKIFCIKDNGIGMNEDVLLHYYLSAGSSYRFSEEWIKNFTQDRVAEIPRTGKFGVGVLSTFLLGSTIFVQTRHINDSLGYEFSFILEQDNIDIRRTYCEVGTTIKIALSDKILEFLCFPKPSSGYRKKEWFDWYHFQEPAVRYFIDGQEKYKIKDFVPQTNDVQPGWFPFDTRNYKTFQWRYSTPRRYYCNGIEIPHLDYHSLGRNCGMWIDAPSISLVDPACNLSINLDRSSILKFPDEEDFIREAYKYYLAKLLIVKWDKIEDSSRNIRNGFFYGGRQIYYPDCPDCRFILSNKGYTLFSAPFLCKAKSSRILLVCFQHQTNTDVLNSLNPHIPLYLSPMTKNRESIAFYKSVANKSVITSPLSSHGYDITANLYRVWGEKVSFDEKRSKMQKSFFFSHDEVPTHEAYYRYDSHRCHSPIPIIESDLDPHRFPIIAEYSINLSNSLKNNVMLEIMEQYLGDDIWIPFDMQERREKFPYAFQELAVYMV